MANDSNKEVYGSASGSYRGAPRVLRLGLLSAVSAVAGGLAVAWWYRKTLNKLQNPIVHGHLQKEEFQEFEEDTSGSGEIRGARHGNER